MKIGPGSFVAIGGPSGVGKDTLIRYARERLADDARFLFVRRTITRPPDQTSEDHHSVDEAEFQRLAASGSFALTWSAHGLQYGLPIAINDAIANARVVVSNISRTVLPELEARYARVLAIAISADPAEVQARLVGRGREDERAIKDRSQRVVEERNGNWIEIRNSGPIADAGDELVRRLLAEAWI